MKTSRTSRLLAIGFALTFAITQSGSALAANMNWGDISSPGGSVVFEDVTEDNGEATTLFAPEVGGPSVVGDMLILDPQGFQSQSNDSADLIDSTLTTTIASNDGSGILTIDINEFGDYTLGGLSSGEAFASVGAAFFWRVTEIDGSPVGLASQMAQLSVSGGGMYNRPGDDGTAVPWSGSVGIDVASYLASNQIAGSATKVTLRFDNTLQTAADSVSNAFIKKKGVDITVHTGDPKVPEPTTVALLALGAAMLTTGRRVG